MKIARTFSRASLYCAVALLMGNVAQAQSASYNATIEIIEVWKIGNVAFRLNGVSSTCGSNNWFVINKSAEGGKNMYAALLAAKLADRPIRVSSPGCGPADSYNTTPYVLVDYLYVAD
jgi:hypothetical protein